MNKAVFIDRDGVINNDHNLYYIHKPDDFKLNEDIVQNIVLLKNAGFLVIVISNQGGIGKGLYKKEDTERLHEILKEELLQAGSNIDEIYYCPHHPDTSQCLCRKPGSLLIEKAIARFNINPSLSYMIGDSQRDIEAAEKAGIKGILVPKNSNIKKICNKIIGYIS
jgi:D-glycero-D-manno-heptose 1,7-bisphosphate phosphatase